jgi:two-component system NtrC family sensor kinase
MTRRNASGSPTTVRRGGPRARKAQGGPLSIDQSPEQFDNLKRERDVLLEQLAATSEVLQVISRSPTELQSVLDMVGESAARLCEANNAVIFRLEGNLLRQVASYGGIPTTSHPKEGLPVNRGRVTSRAVCERRTIHVHDLAAEVDEYPEGSSEARRDGHRTTLATPLLREGIPIGAILIRRMKVRPFSKKQIALLDTFAAQAVIAIENTRLLNELRQRTDELTESLEQQTATSEVLSVISSSVTDAQPVFNMIAENAARLCDAQFCFVYRFDGKLLHFVAHRSLTPEVLELNQRSYPAPPSRGSVAARAILERRIVQIPDVSADPEYALGKMAAVGGYRSAVAVPIMRDGIPVGSIAVTRARAGLLSDRQIDLLRTFADQAVIAIENVRLFEAEQERTRELRQRTDDLTESLEQQTATSEVLQVISSSPGELEPVFNVMLANAIRICGATFGNMFLREGDGYRLAAAHGEAAFVER